MSLGLLCKLPQNLSPGQLVVGDFSGSVGLLGGVWAPEGRIHTQKPPMDSSQSLCQEQGSELEGNLEDLSLWEETGMLSWGV